jgi:hypothetical protein
MNKFHIQTPDGPQEVEGQAYACRIGNREARLFIHTESALEGARLSCQRSGMLVGKLAPIMLARFVATGDTQNGKETVGAALLVSQLIAKHGAERLWKVMDSAPSLFPNESAAA